jgi:hypothetical protein
MKHGRTKLQFYTEKNLAGGVREAQVVVQFQDCDCFLLGGKKVFNAKYAKDSRRAQRKAPHKLHHYRISGEKESILADPVLQSRRQLVHVPGGKVHHFRVKHRDTVASDGIPPHLDQ